jgi:hypothetical protein
MAKIIRTTATGFTRILARFTRRTDSRTAEHGSRWYDCDVSSRGL